MKTGKTLQGSFNLVFDAVDATTHIAESMYSNIAATSWPIGKAPGAPANGVAGFVYSAIRKVNAATRITCDKLFGSVSPVLDRKLAPGPHREAVISVLNGIFGDHLAQSGNTLAISMSLRVMLPPQPPSLNAPLEERLHQTTAPEVKRAFANLLEMERRTVEVYPQPNAHSEESFSPGKRLLVVAHGLCMHDRTWTSHQHNHAESLAESHGYTPVYVLYNSGRHVSTNGRELCHQLAGLVDAWPGPLDSITLIGFSMGGLVTRSAMHIAQEEGHDWLGKVDKSVYVGTPHHGAIMERGGYWLQKSFTISPYTAPLSALGRVRSAGITDLRHGNIQDDDWLHHDEHEDNSDYRRPSPLPGGIAHYAIGATLSKNTGERTGKLRGDGLVHPSSALGRHQRPELNLAFPDGHTKIIHGLGHLAMLHDSRVMNQLHEWLGEPQKRPE